MTIPVTIGLTCVAVLTVSAVTIAVLGIRENFASAETSAVTAPVFAPVSSGSVVSSIDADFSLEPSTTILISAPDLGGVPAIITHAGVAQGDEIAAGSVVATVSDRPIFALPGNVPSYRALSTGMTGADVGRLQRALSRVGTTISDRRDFFGPSTTKAVIDLYEGRGFAPLGMNSAKSTVSIELGEIVFMPHFPAVALESCGNRGVPLATTEICKVASGAPRMVLNVPTTVARDVDQGQLVSAQLETGQPFTGSIGTRLTPQPSAAEPEVVQYEVISTSPIATEFSGGSGTARIVTAQSAADALIVPQIALRAADDGSNYLDVLSPGASAGHSVPVTLGVCDSGVCEVSGHIDVKDKVQVSQPTG